MKNLWSALILLIAVSCGPHGPSFRERLDAAVDSTLASYTIDQKAWQLIHVRTTALQDSLYPVGGIVLFAYDVKDSAQLMHLVDSLHALPSQPLISIDEEGGRVARIGRNTAFNVPRYESMAALSGPSEAYQCGHSIGLYLAHWGIDINFAPVADVNTNPENIVIGNRAFSSDPSVAAPMVVSYLKGLSDAGIYGCLKHFPGHGDTKADTHFGYASTEKTWEEMLECEMIPFKAGIKAGAPLVMSAHISAPNVTSDEIPATMSRLMLTEKLRGELGFKGVIVTDGLSMGAITRQYSSGEAAVGAILAGADILLLPEDALQAHDAIVSAVEDSIITPERLDQSLRRILELKLSKQIN